MAYHPRIESKIYPSFLTTRTRASRLWFVNNKRLERAILGNAARCARRYSVKLYALAIEGNHIQGPAAFPDGNRANFMRDFNSSVARAVPMFTPEYDGGRFWARRYSSEFLPGPDDVEEYFFYTVLQPIKDGLVEKLSDYPGYNCFNDAIRGIKRKYRLVRWAEFNVARRWNPRASIKDFVEIVTLEYARLPGYEDLSQSDYCKLMQEKFERRRLAIVADRAQRGLGFLGKAVLLSVERGAFPLRTKTSTYSSHRPRVLSICPTRRAECKSWYFNMYFSYRDASRAYRNGDFSVQFPEGTYRPYLSGAPPSLLAA